MIDLKDRPWKVFIYSELFDIKRGFYNNKPRDRLIGSGIPFVAASMYSNGNTTRLSLETINSVNSLGIDCDQDKNNLFPPRTITIANNGASVGCAFYHSYSYTTSNAVNVLTPKFNNNKYISLFINVIVGKDKFRWSYGRTWIVSKMRNSKMKLPIDIDGNPDWQFMEDYIKQFEETKLLEIQKTDYKEDVKLPDVKEWGNFSFSELFDLKRGSMAKKPDKSGSTPYISSSGMNNALTGMYEVDDKHIIDKSLLPLITVANNGSVGSSFIQELPFSASSDVSLLLPKFQASKEMLVFIKIIIEESKDLYSYGRKWGLDKMRNSELKLPVLDDGSPDFDLIERYIKSLPYSEMI